MDKQIDRRQTAADYLIASKRCDILSLEQLLRMGRLVVSVSNLVHALQRERGVSNMYVASGGHRFADQLRPLRERTHEKEAQFLTCLDEIDTESACLPGASRLFSRIAYVIHGLDALETIRAAVDPLNVDSETLMTGYSDLVQGLLAVVFEAADSAADPDVSRELVAMFHLMQGKEFAGQERAVGAAGFARGGLDAAMAERLRHLIDSQERCFEIFAQFADEASQALWRDSEVEPCSADMERLRRIAFASTAEGGVNAEYCDLWFELASRRIDAMKQIEDQIEATLDALCHHKIEAARDDLNSHRNEIDALAEQHQTAGSFAVFVNGELSESAGTTGSAAYSADMASSQLGRSLADLVQTQSRRLQEMSEELNAARAALDERKTIEKAKGLIMRHRRLSEEEAYKFLRQLAMAQSRKLAEVAVDTINMADIFRTSGDARRSRES